ncbi:hypothetical protein F5050DRAFT_843298 [Lentinula boryana]|uniref:Uncharacterized protein n=1 Tax=Lentinula boryana TaxID=40481 RepID=A0ABQ8Q2C6_9AGAR|nr:hypothetical protein F5050DRAFT_843298 [Lentinula boryana]
MSAWVQIPLLSFYCLASRFLDELPIIFVNSKAHISPLKVTMGLTYHIGLVLKTYYTCGILAATGLSLLEALVNTW